MSRKRDLREEERALWDDVTRDVRRFRAGVPKPAKTADDRRQATRVREAAAAGAVRKPASFGVDGATGERLKRGKIEPDAVLDLHGFTQAQAHSRLLSFVRRAHEHEYRCLLVITGKGSPLPARGGEHAFAMGERSKAGVLKTMAPRWLEEERALIAGVQTAHAKHGGAGALYVYLRRKRSRQ